MKKVESGESGAVDFGAVEENTARAMPLSIIAGGESPHFYGDLDISPLSPSVPVLNKDELVDIIYAYWWDSHSVPSAYPRWIEQAAEDILSRLSV